MAASSKPVGILTQRIPKIQNILITDTGAPAPDYVQDNALSRFLVYKNSALTYTSEQDLLKQIYDNNIEFSITELDNQNIKNEDWIELNNTNKYRVVEIDGHYLAEKTEEPWVWQDSNDYSVTETEIPNLTEFVSVKGTNNRSYSFTYKRI